MMSITRMSLLLMNISPHIGCYPKCPPEQPFFDEDNMKCVQKDQCGCYDKDLGHFNPGDTVPTTKNCVSW